MKTAWALGAAFVAVVLVLVVFSVLATEMGSAERLSSSEALDGIDVPTIGTVGDFPDPAHRVVVNVTTNGTIVVDGKTLTADALGDELGRLARVEMPSVVLRVDGALPWGATNSIITECWQDTTKWRLFLDVAHETDRTEGAVEIPWRPMTDCDDASNPPRYVAVWGSDGKGTPEALFADLRQSPSAETNKLVVILDVERSVSTRTVARFFDASWRAEAIRVDLELGESLADLTTSNRFLATAQQPRDLRTAYDVRIHVGSMWTAAEGHGGRPRAGDPPGGPGRPLAPDAPVPPMPPVARVRGAPAGVPR